MRTVRRHWKKADSNPFHDTARLHDRFTSPLTIAAMSQPTRSLAAAAPMLAAMIVAACAGCSSPVRGGIQVSTNQDFTLQPGERATLPGRASLHYVGVANDSRCAPTVQCVWAGDAEVKLVFEQAGKPVDVVMRSANPAPQPMGPWLLTLVGLEHGAAPAATLRLQAGAGGAG